MPLEVFRSSAGSGKTTTLVRKYLSIILATKQTEQFRNILAITFTNKAAGEMKERILSDLHKLSTNPEYPAHLQQWADEFCKQNRITPLELRNRAAAILSKILHRYSDFSVSTIDKFSHRIIRQFAFDLGISSDFRVELDANAILEQAVQKVIDKAGEDPVLTRFLVSFIVSKAEDEKGWNIEGDISSLGIKLFDEASENPIQKLRKLSLDDFLTARDQLLKDTNSFLLGLENRTNSILEYALKNGLEVGDFLNGSRYGFLRLIERIHHGDLSILVEKRLDSFVNGEGYFKSAEPRLQALSSHIPQLSKYSKDIVDFFHREEKDFFRKKALLPTLYALGSLIEIHRALKEISQDENLIHISEFNRLISATIKDQPAPYIYERLGEKYQYVFIDEFQDTSVMQWQNLIPLVDHVLGSGGSALLVGDAKQSIYRWRGGESEQFRMLPEVAGDDRLARERSSAFQQAFSLQILDDNHRSAHDIVKFNNAFFASITTEHEAWRKVYSDVAQNAQSRILSGAVWINPLEAAKNLTAAESAEHVLDAVLDFINLTQKEHRTLLKEITILTRNRREGSDIAAFLLGNGVHVVSPESILINRAPRVNALLAGLSFLVHPDDGPSKLTWLYANADAPVISSEMPSPGDEFNQIKRNYYRTDAPSAVLHALCKIRNWSPLNDVFLQFFFDKVADYEMNAEAPSCHHFLHWWSENEHAFNVILPEGMDAVQIMTVHKAKGLQFPVVIFPFFDFDTNLKNGTLLWADLDPDKSCGLPASLIPVSAKSSAEFCRIIDSEKEKVLLDALNLLYVALTRACNHLALIPSYPGKGSRSQISKWLQKFLSEHPATHKLTSWEVYGNPAATLREEPAAAEIISPEKPSLLFQFAEPDWAKPDYSFSEDQPGVQEGIKIHEELSLLALGASVKNPEAQKIWFDIQSHTELNMVFSDAARLFPEREIYSYEGKTLRPDLLIENSGVYYIIDYKTGTKSPEHILQVQSYSEALTKAGYSVGGAWLLYINENPELQKVAS